MPPIKLAPPAPKKMIEIPKTSHGGLVSIIHPAVRQPFLTFPSCPTPSGDYGVQFGLILDACRIIAQNKDGRLTTDQKGQKPVSSQDLELWLPPRKYYYHLKDKLPDFDYPLCFDFDSWEPPSEPPPRWIDALSRPPEPVIGDVGSNASNFTRNVDQSCLLTGLTVGLNTSHLIPRANWSWFLFYELRDEIPGTSADLVFNSPANLITLSVLNSGGLDESYFTFIPMSAKYVVYALRDAPQLIATLHTQEVNFPERIPVKFIYCRFAWNVITRARQVTQTISHIFKQVSVPADLQMVIDKSKSKKRKVDHADEGEMDEDGSVQSGSSFPSLSRYARVIPSRQWTLDALKKSQKYDEKLKKAYGNRNQTSGIYPGFSDIQAVAFKYVSENHAATDPGGARLATWAEILAGDE